MGLDMYLKAKVYLSYNDEARQKIARLIGHAEFEVTHVELEVGYWRKANAIHKWFVDHVQNGQDDCGQHFVADRHLFPDRCVWRLYPGGYWFPDIGGCVCRRF